VARLTREITQAWLGVYHEEADKVLGVCHGTTPWSPMFSKEKSYIFQCDLSYMFGNAQFREMVVPDIEACCEEIPSSFYHLDGKNALQHLDSLLEIKKLKGIQWIPGAGQPDGSEWPEVLDKIRAAGKFCEIHLSADAALKLKRKRSLEGFIIPTWMPAGSTPEQARAVYEELTA
jgi:hypothetical protein